MSLVPILEFGDDGVLMKIEVDTDRSLVCITEGYNTDFPVSVAVTVEGLADIIAAVEQYLEIESAAEYIDDIILED